MMRTEMVERRVGEDCGPIDWTHEAAREMPDIWREAEQYPERFQLDVSCMTLSRVIALRMYDGWPQWRPRPAILREGPLGPEWTYFDSYGVGAASIVRRIGEVSP